MAGVPKTKIEDVSARFHRFIGAYTETLKVNMFAYNALEADYKRLVTLPEFEADARTHLGHLYSYILDEAGFRHNFERARQLEGKTPSWRVDFISAALNFGFFQEAKAELDAPWDFSNPEIIRAVRSYMISTGLFESAARLTRTLQSMRLDARHSNSATTDYMYDEIFCAEEIIKESGATELFVMERIIVASKLILDRVKKPLHRYAISVNYDSGIQYSFAIDDTPENLVELDWAIAEKLVETFDEPMSHVISLVTRPL